MEVLPPDFVEVGLQAQLGVRPGATKEEVKAVYKKAGLVVSAVGNHITNCNADTTRNGQPPTHTHHIPATTRRTLTPTMAERAQPHNNNRGQPTTAQDNPK